MGIIRVSAKSESSLDVYFKELARTRADEDASVTGNLKLVVYFAKKYRQKFRLSADDMADLIQAGSMGLMEAAKKYRDCGKRFSTYAAYYIKSAILREIDGFGHIRLPENKRKEIRKAAAAARYLEQEGCRKPGDEDLARCLGWEPKKARDVSLLAKTSLPLELPAQDEQIGDRDEALGVENYRLDPAELVIRKDRENRCREALSALPAKEKEVLELRYGFRDGRYQTMEETGKRFGITRQSVCEIEAQAKKRLREALWDLEDVQTQGGITA